MAQSNKRGRGALKAILLLLLSIVCVAITVFADPSGATVVSNFNVTGPVITPAIQNTSRGTITTMVLNAMQQNQQWKAYIGNISGGLTLDNPSGSTIYSWDLATISGQIYASRYNNISWANGNIVCASAGVIASESTFNNMTFSEPDKLNSTFNWTVHKQFQVGTNVIAQSSCSSTAVNANDSRQVPTTTSPFQEVLIMDNTYSYLVYMASIDDNRHGYDSQLYDFQMIVAESDLKATPTPYYFYVELR